MRTYSILPQWIGEDKGESESGPNYQVKYFTDQELEQYVVQIQDGLVIGANGEKLNVSYRMFMLSPEGVFVVGPEKEHYVIHHTSITQGKPVQITGRITIINGQIIEFDALSGHYQITKDGVNSFLQYLSDKGINTEGIDAIYPNEPPSTLNETASESS